MKKFMTHKPLLLVDFDRTLFDTSAFVDWLWQAMEQVYGIDAAKEKERAKEFYIYSASWYDYLFFDHLRAIPQLSSSDLSEFIKRMQALPGTPDFLFPDGREILGRCDEIVTFGNEPYQQFKLGFCPELASIPTRIIQTAKAQYITANYHQSVVLVDDKHLEDELPEWVVFILIDRSEETPVRRHRDNFYSVNSLTELKHIVTV